MANQLKDAQSLYLKQHSEDPIHWLEYNEQNIKIAKERNRPILMSIGYSSCHWCHQMKQETFSDPVVAKFLNDNFTAFKIDREEHPEIDQYYQKASQLFTGQGGWPLNALVTPEFKPFFVGTYFPKDAQGQIPGFTNLLNELLGVWNKDKESLKQNAEEAETQISEISAQKIDEPIEFPGHFPHPGSIFKAISNFKDSEFGGYGEAPKFPNFNFYEFACEQLLENNLEEDDAKHLLTTFESILSSSLIDQVRGGCHRYSVSKDWNTPHFEKMLIDQAGLVRFLAKLSLYYPTPIVYDHIVSTLDYLRNEMLSEDNYFFTSQDADSEGVEGLYFTYTKNEIREALESYSQEHDVSIDIDYWQTVFNATEKGNFEDGLNTISIDKAELKNIFGKEKWGEWREVRKALLEERKQRIPPSTDNKGVASWNFQLVTALCDVYQYCPVKEIKVLAANLFKQTLSGVLNTFCIKDEEGKTKIMHTTTLPGKTDHVEDYISFAECMLRSYEITGNENFKQNFKNVITMVTKEFVEGDKLLNLNKTKNSDNIFSQVVATWDQGEKSPLSNLIHLVRRGEVFLDGEYVKAEYQGMIDQLTQMALRNPLAHGEALRALTYPQTVYRTLKVPKVWADREEFISRIHFFLPRFILSFEKGEKDNWEICNNQSCELTDNGLDSLFKILAPKVDEKKQEK